MIVLRAWRWLSIVVLALAACGGSASAGPSASSAANKGDPSRQVLVLLRLPPQHYRPSGAAGGPYDDAMGHSGRLRVANRLARAHGLTLVTDWPMPLLGVDCYVLAVPEGHSVQDEVEVLSRDPDVAWSQAMHVYHAEGTARRAAAMSPDPLFRLQPAASQWRLADLHQIATGRNVLVAVVDSQVDRAHPDLLGQVRIARDFAPGRPSAGELHGTGVAAIIVARADNGVGIVGVAPGARLMALRACWQPSATSPATVCDSLTLAQALHFAIENHAQVINLSLSGPPDGLLGRLVDVAESRGVTVVGAFDTAAPGGGFPASHPGVVAVSDAPVEPPRAGLYSAPGRDVPTTEPGGRWSLVNGSSYAAAHVSGLVALMRQRDPSMAHGRTLVASRSGGGMIDACASLTQAVGPCDCSCAHTSRLAADNRRR
jgi:subtilisin family serine protease